ncbi:MAG TPA: hypothetical protein VMM18_14915 [Gemmatimonadaceae bacterium]|nr:hypothetical protein [Gemmatimonadaceae bacterium]
MTSFFLTCAALGGAVLLLQLVLGLFGIGDDHAVDHHGIPAGKESLTHGLHLFSVRALSAGIAFFGVGGLAGMSTAFGLLAAVPLALISGSVATVAVAAIMRAMMRLEDDGTVQIHGAVGTSGTVYLAIPGDRSGVGKVHVTLQNRLVELQAVTSQQSLPTGSRVLVIDVVGPDTVDVVPDPIALEVPNVAV